MTCGYEGGEGGTGGKREGRMEGSEGGKKMEEGRDREGDRQENKYNRKRGILKKTEKKENGHTDKQT